jgi:hypothetical protein
MVCLPEAILNLLSAGLKSGKHSVSYTHFSVHNFGDLEAMLGTPEGARIACHTYHNMAMK